MDSMSLGATFKRQTCVYWAPAGEESGGQSYDDAGQPQFSTPVELSCRWDDTIEKVTNAVGEEVISKSQVMVDDTVVGGVLMLGVLADVSYESEPFRNSGAYQIHRIDGTPTVSADEIIYVAYL